MNIRSITIGVNLEKIKSQEKIISKFILEGKKKLKNYNVRTIRIVTDFVNAIKKNSNQNIYNSLNEVNQLCKKNSIRWFCVPINVNLLENNKLDPNFIINILDKFENSFINLHIDYDEKDKNLFKKIKFCSEVIKLTSKISSNGYDNFRLGVSCNVKKNSPFFPYSFNGANNLSYSIAIENIGSFYKIVKNSNKNYFSLENLFIKKLSNHLINLNKIFINLGKKNKINYLGMDNSLAPIPDKKTNSVANLIEEIGKFKFGSNGTVFITALLTKTIKKLIDKTKIKSIGFNGVMYSVLEDEILCKRFKERTYDYNSLTLYSTVCGCGNDMIPVPGNISVDEISSKIIDTLRISNKLDKPLGVRLLPIPEKESFEDTDFNTDFLINTSVFPSENSFIEF
tara:strand:- start:67 stop:1257 length:1191 start_codon:yes stop_codon:yes gene_type:complete